MFFTNWIKEAWKNFIRPFDDLNVEPDVLQPRYFLHSDEYSKFPINDLGELIIEFYNRLTVVGWQEGYMWKSTTHNTNENYKRGEVFETKIWEKISAHRFKNDYLLTNAKREMYVGKKSRADFVLEWKISNNKILNVLIEAKHSVNYEHYGVKKGIKQLHRYKKTFREANLLILLVDFRISGKLMSIRGRIIILNYQLLDQFLELISEFVKLKKNEEQEYKN